MMNQRGEGTKEGRKVKENVRECVEEKRGGCKRKIMVKKNGKGKKIKMGKGNVVLWGKSY